MSSPNINIYSAPDILYYDVIVGIIDNYNIIPIQSPEKCWYSLNFILVEINYTYYYYVDYYENITSIYRSNDLINQVLFYDSGKNVIKDGGYFCLTILDTNINQDPINISNQKFNSNSNLYIKKNIHNEDPMMLSFGIKLYDNLALNIISIESPIISNICFVKDTLVLTDQGFIEINKIDININTINNNKIIAITNTISEDDYLICFAENSIDINYPIKETIMTCQHKILYNNKMEEANIFFPRKKLY